jgi:hypothetical protein
MAVLPNILGLADFIEGGIHDFEEPALFEIRRGYAPASP